MCIEHEHRTQDPLPVCTDPRRALLLLLVPSSHLRRAAREPSLYRAVPGIVLQLSRQPLCVNLSVGAEARAQRKTLGPVLTLQRTLQCPGGMDGERMVVLGARAPLRPRYKHAFLLIGTSQRIAQLHPDH